VVAIPFTAELASVSAEAFVGALVEEIGMRLLVGGPDLALGHGRQGTPEFLRSVGDRLGFSVDIVEACKIDGHVVRTSAIREALTVGDLSRASMLLGRNYAVEGDVVRGVGRGRTIGVPTANLRTPVNIVLPANGVYAVRFRVDDQTYGGAANLGVRPTFDGIGRSLEVHLLDFSGDLYGRNCQVEFIELLRPEQRFPSVDQLVQQIKKDIEDARRVVKSPSG
jgi:riboflavin kinase/FMN adenylyltransferase